MSLFQDQMRAQSKAHPEVDRSPQPAPSADAREVKAEFVPGRYGPFSRLFVGGNHEVAEISDKDRFDKWLAAHDAALLKERADKVCGACRLDRQPFEPPCHGKLDCWVRKGIEGAKG